MNLNFSQAVVVRFWLFKKGKIEPPQPEKSLNSQFTYFRPGQKGFKSFALQI